MIPANHSMIALRPSLRTAKFYLMTAVGLLMLMSNSHAAEMTCPAVENIQQQKGADGGYNYSAISVGSGWQGENPDADEALLKTLKFESATIKEGVGSKINEPFYYVTCDYVGGVQDDYLRLSQRFPTPPRAVGDHWKEKQCTRSSVAECGFDPLSNAKGPAPVKIAQ